MPRLRYQVTDEDIAVVHRWAYAKLREATWPKPDVVRCEYFALCGGGAPANKYYENGTLQSTETMHCRYTTQLLVDIVLKDLERVRRSVIPPVQDSQEL